MVERGWLGIGLDGGQRDHLPHRRLVPRRELLDEVGVVAHLDAHGKATALADGLRHGSAPPPKGGSTRRLRSTCGAKVKIDSR